jgi:AcrR family transcriptional regulator
MAARAQATAATRERLLAAAWRHFATRPYEEVLLREIAAEAAVTAQTLHLHFGAKDQLLIDAYRWFGKQEISERPPTPTSDIQEAIRLLFDRYEKHGSAILRMLSQAERIPAIHRMTDAGRAYHSHWCGETFKPLLSGLSGQAREDRLAKILLATDLLAWRVLRLDLKLPRERAERVVADIVRASPQPGP